MRNDEEKLKILIKRIIKEELSKINEDYSDELVYKAFVQPFTDVVDTAMHGVKTTAASVIGNTKKLALQAGAAFIPYIGATVSKIGEKEEKKLANKLAGIDKEYADVLKRNWDTLRTRDVSFILFMMDPKLYLGSTLALKAPEAAFDVLDSIVDSPAISKWHNTFKELNKRVMPPAAGGSGYSGGGGGGSYTSSDFNDAGYSGWESKTSNKPVLKEELTKDVINQKASITLKRILADKSIQRKIDNSPIVKEMQKEALKLFIDQAKQVSNFNAIEQFSHLFGKEFDKTYAEVSSKVEEKGKEEFDQALIPELKKNYAKVISTYLNSLKSTSPSAEQEIKNTISTIERML